MFLNKNLFGTKPFNFAGVKFKGTLPTGPQTQPTGPTVAPPMGAFQGAPKAPPIARPRPVMAPGFRVAKALADSRPPTDSSTPLGAFAHVFGKGVDAWNMKREKEKQKQNMAGSIDYEE